MSKGSRLVKNTAIYAVGNFGSKILAYVMVLVYSYYISTDELGVYDLIVTTTALVQPLVLLQINEGVYRYLIGEQDFDVTLSTGFRFICFTSSISSIIWLIGSHVFGVSYSWLILIYSASSMFYLYFSDAIRGLGDNYLYAATGVVNSIVMLVFEVAGLVVFRLGFIALLISKSVANLFCIILMLKKEKRIRGVLRTQSSLIKLRELLNYSVPLVPNTVCWWLINSSDRYIVLIFLGTAFNGIFSMAHKFPTILSTVASIFYLAWQESAIKEYDSKDRDAFFSGIFDKYSSLLLSLSFVAVPATQIVISLFVSSDYKTAWLYAGLLYLGATFSALSSFLGIGYQISKETKRSIATTIFAAMLNAVINISLISVIGLQAASLSTFVSYFFLFLIRIRHTKKYFTLSVKWIKVISMTIACLISTIICCVAKDLRIAGVIMVVGILYCYAINYNSIILPMLKKIRK